jgi:hypothetical protein
VFLTFSSKENQGKKFENAPFSFGNEMYEDVMRERAFYTSSFRDEMYGDVKTSRYNVRGCIVRGRNVRGHNGDVSYKYRRQSQTSCMSMPVGYGQ